MYYIYLLAIIPCIVIAYMIYRADKKEKEPVGEIVKAFLMGVVAIFITLFISQIFGLYKIDLDTNMFHIYLYSFFGIALVEEVSKYLCSIVFVNRNSNFNYLFDGIVYFTCVSLGFALIENILYANVSGISDMLARAFTAIPAHTFFGISSGYYYSLYKKSKYNKEKNSISFLILSIIVPIILHGFYDFCILVGNDIFFYTYIVFMVCLYYYSFSRIKKMQDKDDLIKK